MRALGLSKIRDSIPIWNKAAVIGFSNMNRSLNIIRRFILAGSTIMIIIRSPQPSSIIITKKNYRTNTDFNQSNKMGGGAVTVLEP
jgi:hypothetical protein